MERFGNNVQRKEKPFNKFVIDTESKRKAFLKIQVSVKGVIII